MRRTCDLPSQAIESVKTPMEQRDQEFTVDLQPIGRRAKVTAGQNVLAAAQSVGVELQAVCGGAGTCGQCKVRCVSGNLARPTEEERSELCEDDLKAGYRLACQAIPSSDLILEIPSESLTSSQRVQIEGGGQRVSVDSILSLDDLRRGGPLLGLAVDLGTTKIAAYLVNLETGQTLAARGVMNPQIAYGEDVISRISFAGQAVQNRNRLQRKVIEALNKLALDLCAETQTSPQHIFEAVVAGNTAMQHLFAGFPVQQLGTAPFLPASTRPIHKPAKDFGLRLAEAAGAYTPPNIAGYVGGDHVAMLLGIGIGDCPHPTLAIDIGTNTELTLITSGRLLTCSCASGPAFEGAHIKHGMRAAPGAIERVQFESGTFHYYTVERRPPAGICGSGILDAIAALLDAGAIDERGNFRNGVTGIRHRDAEYEFLLVSPDETEHRKEIVLTRQDISEIQFAKAAIRAGIEVLLDLGQVDAKTLKSFVIAGAFGSYLDLRSAVRIGLFPEIPLRLFKQVGNAVGLGARQMLASATQRRRGEELAERIEYIELTNHPQFHEKFVKALLF
jgi:uncharacterized 2Fe-2S/4Fe-4S cluster protein (DUF4445 family)